MELFETPWAKYGLYYGLLSILISLISFYIMPINVWVQSLLGIVLMILMMYLGGKAEKSERGGILPYKQALKATFLTGFVGLVIATLFTIIMMHLVDPGLIDKAAEMGSDAARSVMESIGTPPEQMEEAMEKIEEEAASALTPQKQLMGILTGSIVLFIVAAIISLFVRKEEDPNQFSVKDIGEV